MLIVDTEPLNYDGLPWPFQESQDGITKIIEEVTALITPETALSFPAAASTLIQICDELGSASEHLNEPNMKQFAYAAGRAEKAYGEVFDLQVYGVLERSSSISARLLG
ncbi:hypothetical protein ECAE60S_01180 [Eoetvoesiella caeni]